MRHRVPLRERVNETSCSTERERENIRRRVPLKERVNETSCAYKR